MHGMPAGADAAGVMATEAAGRAVLLRPFTPRSCRSANRIATSRTVPPIRRPPGDSHVSIRTDPLPAAHARAGGLFLGSFLPRGRRVSSFSPTVCTEDICRAPPGAAVLRRSAMPCTHVPCGLAASCPFFFFLLYFSAKLKIGRDRPTRVPDEEIFPTPAARLVAADVWPAPLRSERSRLYSTVLLLTEI